MADAGEETKRQEDSEETKEDIKTSPGGVLRWIIMAVVVVICAGAGFGLGRLFGGSGIPKTAEPSQQDQLVRAGNLEDDDSTTASEKDWYYPLEPVVACLDEPGVTRYIRSTLTLRISAELSVRQGTALLEKKKPMLINWISIYLASLRLDDVRGEKNQRHIQLQILDAFNESLFPDAKPQIKEVLFKEFVVQ